MVYFHLSIESNMYVQLALCILLGSMKVIKDILGKNSYNYFEYYPRMRISIHHLYSNCVKYNLSKYTQFSPKLTNSLKNGKEIE